MAIDRWIIHYRNQYNMLRCFLSLFVYFAVFVLTWTKRLAHASCWLVALWVVMSEISLRRLRALTDWDSLNHMATAPTACIWPHSVLRLTESHLDLIYSLWFIFRFIFAYNVSMRPRPSHLVMTLMSRDFDHEMEVIHFVSMSRQITHNPTISLVFSIIISSQN